jgi:diadenosine tetraphosphatase ApaH/serine/threonine PP2A family protein phosphatase
VGRPKDGDWRACYAVVTLDEGPPAVEVVRVEYDVAAAAAAVEASPLPDAFAEVLRSGRV